MTDRNRNRYNQGRRGLDDPYTRMEDRGRQGGQGYDRGQYSGREVDDTDFGYGRGDDGRGEYGRDYGYGPGRYERIREDACEILTQHGGVDAREIEIDIENGEITLRGTLDSRQAKRMAEDAIENISGVKEVHNQLRVSQVPTGQSGTAATTGMRDQQGTQGMQGSERQRAVGGGGERSNQAS